MNLNSFIILVCILGVVMFGCLISEKIDDLYAQLNTIQYQTSGCYPHPEMKCRDYRLKDK